MLFGCIHIGLVVGCCDYCVPRYFALSLCCFVVLYTVVGFGIRFLGCLLIGVFAWVCLCVLVVGLLCTLYWLLTFGGWVCLIGSCMFCCLLVDSVVGLIVDAACVI